MNLIKQLVQTKNDTLELFGLPDEDLNKTYSPGKWNVRFILHHLADTETVLFDRIRRIISEPDQIIQGFDQDAWANKLNYMQRPLELSEQIYSSARTGTIYYANHHYKKHGDLKFIHNEDGTRTLKDEMDKVAMHNQHHIDQIYQALRATV